MRTCPTCGEYYEGGPLAFCLADGTPLADVDPSSEKWDEAARAVREKAEKLSRRGRRLKWRRGAVRVLMTMLTTVVVCIVVINGVSVIYQSPPRDGGTGHDNDNRNDNINRNGGGSGNDNAARCSAADRSREWEALLGSCRVTWQSAVEGERPRIVAEFARRGVEPRLGPIDYAPPVFSDDCQQATVTASYKWLLTSPTGDVPVPRTKPFTCRKLGRGWTCG